MKKVFYLTAIVIGLIMSTCKNPIMKKSFYLIAIVGFIFASCTKPEKPNPNEERTYSFSIEAEKEADDIDNSDGSSQTRIEIINNLLHWSVGDKVGLYITEANRSTLIVNNLAMTGNHSEPVKATSFTGTLTQSEIESLNPNNTYRCMSYFPYSTTVTAPSASTIVLSIPQTITVRKNEFPTDQILMLASPTDAFPPITWLDENGEQQWDKSVSFTYRHMFSYVRVKLNTNLTSLSVTGIEVSSPSNHRLSGNLFYFLPTGYMMGGTYSNRIIDIETGMDVGDEIYIPFVVPVSYSNNYNYTFKFTFEDGTTSEKIIPVDNFKLQRSKIHNITFNL